MSEDLTGEVAQVGGALDELVQEFKADQTRTAEYHEALDQVHASNRRRSWFQFIGTLVILVPIVVILVNVRTTQTDGAKRGKALLAQNSTIADVLDAVNATTLDTNTTTVILQCALTSGAAHPNDPDGASAALYECTRAKGVDPLTGERIPTKETP